MTRSNPDLSLEEILNLDKLTVEIIYHKGYYDGPLSGLCQVGEERCWFLCLQETSGIPCPKEEWCAQKIHISANNGDGAFSDISDEEWGCPSFVDASCFIESPKRYYGVYRLEEDILKELDRRHILFQKYVGTHTDYNGTETYREPLGKLGTCLLGPCSTKRQKPGES